VKDVRFDFAECEDWVIEDDVDDEVIL